MRTICVMVEDTLANYWTVEKITNDFPCFYNAEVKSKGYVEISITYRQEDAKAIEDRLASIV